MSSRRFRRLVVVFTVGVCIGWHLAGDNPSGDTAKNTLHVQSNSLSKPDASPHPSPPGPFTPPPTVATPHNIAEAPRIQEDKIVRVPTDDPIPPSAVENLKGLSAASRPTPVLQPPPFRDLIPGMSPPLPPGWPAQPPQPVGVMPLKECLDYIKTRQWTAQSDARSQSIACQPLSPLVPLLFGSECNSLGMAPFALTLCWDAAQGVGTVRVEKQASLCAETQKFSKDPETAAVGRARFGPDSIRIRLDGPEVLVVDMHHKGQCNYEGKFRTTVSGWFGFIAKHLFDNYDGITEVKSKTRYLVQPITDKRYRVGLPLMTKEEPDPKTLPHCTHLWDSPARWWKPPKARPYMDPFPPWKFPRTPGKNLEEAHSWGSDAQWAPYNCSWTPVPQEAARQCLKDSTVLFIGDSMTRSFFYPFLNKIWENKIQGNPKITVADGPRKWIVDKTITLQYSPDPFLNEEKMFQTMLQNPNFDVVVLGVGDWPASSTIQPKGLWTFKQYKEHIDQLVLNLAGYKQRTRTRVIWHTIPAFGIADFDAWRNNRRFQLYNDYAVPRLRQHGYTQYCNHPLLYLGFTLTA
mmetsp:Transcript_20061/g.35835  ORF Transcript_20061/g.35835 Transcript_20061/m.35835 type:complete len:576 (-) Transcript_20061:1738-3465(-)